MIMQLELGITDGISVSLVSINVWRLVGDTLTITCNFLYCNHQLQRPFEHLYNMCVCVCVCVCLYSCLSYPAAKLHHIYTALYCNVWHVWEHKMCVLNFSISRRNVSHSKNNASYIGLCIKYLLLSDFNQICKKIQQDAHFLH
jgi:hypothetical protein